MVKCKLLALATDAEIYATLILSYLPIGDTEVEEVEGATEEEGVILIHTVVVPKIALIDLVTGPVTPGVMCCHPRSLDRKVLHPSIPHRSTGSTVATFLPQDHLQEFDFDEPELEVIYER
ncbi:hypothetical protein FSP39_003708 [Pinctada imbricata]|uniref:Uncharacterized protein n=1 Tax=Pinctada imbricata TaxID=66713 RepID=A0AA89BSD3_PINIB|nr:hypothetical protein FSP39_003708 [Pinctada imbricata]